MMCKDNHIPLKQYMFESSINDPFQTSIIYNFKLYLHNGFLLYSFTLLLLLKSNNFKLFHWYEGYTHTL